MILTKREKNAIANGQRFYRKSLEKRLTNLLIDLETSKEDFKRICQKDKSEFYEGRIFQIRQILQLIDTTEESEW